MDKSDSGEIIGIGEGLRMFRNDGVKITYNPELENRMSNGEVSRDLYFTIGVLEAALRIARVEAQRAVEVTALNIQLSELYAVAASPDAATWSSR